MLYSILKFEILYRVKRPETYVFFGFLVLFSMVGVDFIFQGIDLGPVKKNAPIVIAKTMGATTGIFMILASMIMGVPVLRDFQYQVESLLFVNPIKKRDYLLGRFIGSFTVLLFIFSGMGIGMMLGEAMPWHEAGDFMAFSFWNYLKPFLIISVPTLFFGACLFFVTGALSRKLVVVYTQGIILFVVFILTKAITNPTLQALFDPFSLTTVSLVTESWTMEERSLLAIPFHEILMFNKLFWMLLGIVILWFGYKKFKFNAWTTKRIKRKKETENTIEINSFDGIELPQFQLKQGIGSKWNQLTHFSWFYFIGICKQPSFWAIAICGMIIILVNSVSLGTVYGVDSYPETYFIVEELQETSIFFFIIILIFYSGELIWKERTAKVNLIYDATPMSDLINLAGKYIGLILIYVVLIISLIATGIIFQTVHGYYNYDFQVYFNGFFLEILPFLAVYTFIAFFAQVLINQKFVGILVVLVFFIANSALGVLGFDHGLYWFGGNSLGTYSAMNGYGHFLKPYLLVKGYWFLFGLLLLITAAVFSVRGTETNSRLRWKSAKHRLSKPLLKLGGFIVLAFILLGAHIFYNTTILNEYWSGAKQLKFRASYEATLSEFEYIPQVKLIDVNLKIELYPSSRNYAVAGSYLLKNTEDFPVREIHLQKKIASAIELTEVSFEGGATSTNQYAPFDYTIYTLKQALQPGDTVKMKFKQTLTSKGFELANSSTSMVRNGTFLRNSDFPTLGYNKKYELEDAKERARYALPPRMRKAPRDDPNELLNARSGSDSNGINFEIVIGTAKNQTAIAPGNLVKQWTANNRSYFHYKTDGSIINFYSITSAKYEIKKELWQSEDTTSDEPVTLEIYYHKAHPYNIERMMMGMKASLDYYSANFSPYQYRHMRIIEIPRYASYAQAFPGIVPFSEVIGFVLNIDDDKDVDMAFYVTAHELAHQWFGMQVEAANVKGQHLILETLSQYAALMVLKKAYGEEKVNQFLKIQQERYTEGKRKEVREEPALVDVANQDYIYYAKGALVMYEFQKQVGEKNVNLALKHFLADWNTLDRILKTKTDRFATSTDLLGYFRAVTPDSLRGIVNDMFITTGIYPP